MFRCALVFGWLFLATTASAQEMFVYICGNGAKGQGIYLSKLDMKSGKLSEPTVAAENTQPTFLAYNPQGSRLYCTARMKSAAGELAGCIEAYNIDRKSGKLSFISRQATRGAAWYVSLDPSGKSLLVANYDEGSVASFPIKDDGSIGDLASFMQHQGKSVTARQQGPHAHSFLADPASRFAIAADLGSDKLVIYKLEAASGKLTPHGEFKSEVGSGPRHFIFDPHGQRAYVLHELKGAIATLAYYAEKGTFEKQQTISTLPNDFKGTNTSAEILLHPSGKFLYASNRGPDSLAIFRVDSTTGNLSLVGFESTRGRQPRSFCLDPIGHFLLAAAEQDDRVSAFRIDLDSGKLEYTGSQITVPGPTCIRCLQTD